MAAGKRHTIPAANAAGNLQTVSEGWDTHVYRKNERAYEKKKRTAKQNEKKKREVMAGGLTFAKYGKIAVGLEYGDKPALRGTLRRPCIIERGAPGMKVSPRRPRSGPYRE